MGPNNFDEYQRATDHTAIYPGADDLSDPLGLYYVAMGLAGEAGEIANRVKKVMRDSGGALDDETRQRLLEEAGDVQWYLARLATHIDSHLSVIAEGNLEKLLDRKERGTLQGSGDTR